MIRDYIGKEGIKSSFFYFSQTVCILKKFLIYFTLFPFCAILRVYKENIKRYLKRNMAKILNF